MPNISVLLTMNLLALLPANAIDNNSGAFILSSFVVITDAYVHTSPPVEVLTKLMSLVG